MRIIGGRHGGQRIDAPPGRGTRPMLDRVREAMFSTLQPWLPDGHVLDLFAGSGSLGLEALSRGARSARFVERAAGASERLAGNIAKLGEEDRAALDRGDALARVSWGDEPPDVVFFDPPYPLLSEAPTRADLLATVRELLAFAAPEAVLVFHVPRGALAAEELPDGLVARLREYGTNALWYVQADEPSG
ncbi:MAG: 16S rRNA (guanine(966)-N(2))-methyltransferase RsmD [Planctomycetota bacterium]